MSRVLSTALAASARIGGGAAEVHKIAAQVGWNLDLLGSPGGSSLDDVALSAMPTGSDQTERGAWYTPRKLADLIAALALDRAALDRVALGRAALGRVGLNEAARDHTQVWLPSIIDPTCGGGVVLLSLADRLVALGVEPQVVVGHLCGADLDPVALVAARCALGLWSVEQSGQWAELEVLEVDVVHGKVPDSWTDRFVAIAGNPPFLSQLRTRSARSAKQRTAVGSRGYADAAALVLGRCLEWSAKNGTVALLQPRSILGARDAEPIRDAISKDHHLSQIWFDERPMFDAGVRVCLPVVRIGAKTNSAHTVVSQGLPASEVTTVSLGSWPSLAARAAGVPGLDITEGGPSLRLVGEVKADFRQWFYDVAEVVYEGEPDQPHPMTDQVGVLTSGLIDPLRPRWGTARSSIARRHFVRPVIDSAWLAGRVDSWRLAPKVIVANQTKVIEAVADPEGRWVGTTPTLSIIPKDPDDVWAIAALVTSPVVTAWAVERSSGSGLSVGAVRLTAELIRGLPLPADRAGWYEAASMASEGATVRDVGRKMMTAFEVTDEALYSWWANRLPVRRS